MSVLTVASPNKKLLITKTQCYCDEYTVMLISINRPLQSSHMWNMNKCLFSLFKTWLANLDSTGSLPPSWSSDMFCGSGQIFDREGFWPQKSSRMKSDCCQIPERGAERRRTVEKTDEGHDDWRVSRPHQWFDFARGTGLLIVTGSRPSLPLYIHPGVHSVGLIIC